MRLTLFASLCALALPVMAGAGTVTVFAAASLKVPLDQAAAAWKAATGNEVVVSYGASSALAKQIEAGAPADIFLSAATNWMDALDKDKPVQDEVRNVARSVVQAVKELRAGRLSQPDKQVKWPRTK